MKAPLIYCQVTNKSSLHPLQPHSILNCKDTHTGSWLYERGGSLTFPHFHLLSCCLTSLPVFVCIRLCRLRGSATKWSIHSRVHWDRQDRRPRSNTSHWCLCRRSGECWTCRTQRVTQTHRHTTVPTLGCVMHWMGSELVATYEWMNGRVECIKCQNWGQSTETQRTEDELSNAL